MLWRKTKWGQERRVRALGVGRSGEGAGKVSLPTVTAERGEEGGKGARRTVTRAAWQQEPLVSESKEAPAVQAKNNSGGLRGVEPKSPR